MNLDTDYFNMRDLNGSQGIIVMQGYPNTFCITSAFNPSSQVMYSKLSHSWFKLNVNLIIEEKFLHLESRTIQTDPYGLLRFRVEDLQWSDDIGDGGH